MTALQTIHTSLATTYDIPLLLPQNREHRFQLTYNTQKDINVAKDLSTTTTAHTTPKVSGY